MAKTFIQLGLTEEEMLSLLEFAKREEIDAKTAIVWCYKEGLKSFNGHAKQAKLQYGKR